MSLTRCMKEAGDLLPAADKVRILERVAELRRGGTESDEAARLAVGEILAEVRQARVAIGDAPDGAPGARKAAAPSTASAATHQDPGEKPEAATQAVVAESLQKAAKREQVSPKQMLADALRVIDEAIARAPDTKEEEKDAPLKATINVPGDGTFKVLNTKERLREFRALVERSPGFTGKNAKPRVEKAVTSGDLSPNALAREMLTDGEWLNAMEVLDAAGKPMMFGNGTDGEPIPYTDVQPIEIAGFKFFSGHAYSAKKEREAPWRVVHIKSGLAAGWGSTRADAVAQATKTLKEEKAREKVSGYDTGNDSQGKPFPTQDELRAKFAEKAAARQESTFNEQDRLAAIQAEMDRKERERQALYEEIMGAGQQLSSFRTAASSNEGLIRGFLSAAEKQGRAADAIKMLDDVFPESNTWARKIISDWEKAATKNALEVGYNTVKTGAPPYTMTWDEIEPSIDAQVYVTRSATGGKNYRQWKDAHFEAVKQAVERGWRVPDKVLYDYPAVLRSDLNDDQKDLAADAMVTTYQRTKDYGKAVQAYRDWSDKVDLKGFRRLHSGAKGDFTLFDDDADMTVLVYKTKTWDGKDRFQARLKNSTTESGPNLTEQQAVDWADVLRGDMRKAAAERPAPSSAEQERFAGLRERAAAYWDGTVVPAVREYLNAYDAMGAAMMERNRIKPEGMSARDWLESWQSRKSEWDGQRKTQTTGIQGLSQKDLWPTNDGRGERLRKAMLAAIKALKGAPMTNSEMMDRAFGKASDAPQPPAQATQAEALPVNTGANARMVVIEKPAQDASLSRASLDRGAPAVAVERDGGFPTYFNADAGLTIAFPQRTERVEVIEGPGEQVVNYAIMPAEGFEPYGYVELLVKDGTPASLLDIYVNPQARKLGVARGVLETLLAAHPDVDLNVSNIVEGARGFWQRMGIPEQNLEAGAAYDGTLNWQAFKEATNPRGTQGAGRAGGPAREGRDTQAAGAGQPAARQEARGVALDELQDLVDRMEAGGVTKINVVQSVDDLPPAKRATVLRSAPDGRVRGAYFHGSDEIYVVARHLNSMQEAAFVVMHEAFHRGLAKVIGPQAKSLLRRMYHTNGNLRRLADVQVKKHGIELDEAIEEALADMAGEGKAKDLRGWSKLLIMVRDWLATLGRALGFEMTWTDDMVETFVAGMRREGLRADAQINRVDDAVPGAATSRAEEPRAQTGTDAFRRWFAGSKVVDAQGKPLVVYHGTTSDFSAFDPDKRGSSTRVSDAKKGFFFVANGKAASEFTWSAGDMTGSVMPVYLAMGNPFEVKLPGEWEPGKYDAAIDYAKREGRDGVIIRGATTLGTPGDLFIAFRPEQIKSATGNRGTFDPASPDIRLSRATGADTKPGVKTRRATAQSLVNTKGGVFDFNRLGETKQDRIRAIADKAREFWLGAFTRDQIADVYGDDIPEVREYDRLTRAMENQRSKLAQDAEALYEEWSKIDAATNDVLAGVMLDATVHHVHPDQAFTERKSDDAETTSERRSVHDRISQAFSALSPEARAMYGKVKAFHESTLQQVLRALEGRIERQVEAGAARAAALSKIRAQFDQYLKDGPYFPLSRFGDYLVVATREDGERVVASYENSGEQQAAARALDADGFKVKLTTAKAYSREMDGSAGKFIGDVLLAVDKLDMSEATVGGSSADLKDRLMDDLNQLFIRSLPDLSYRKHFAHRQGTPGFSADVMRGFASSAFHAASHIARLNHGDRMTFALRDAHDAISDANEGDFTLRSQVLNELTKRHDAALNPNTHPIASMLNQAGFVMYLGLSPAAGLVNLLQTPMVTLPYLGARYTFGGAAAAMAKAVKDIMSAAPNMKSGWNAAQSPQLSSDERNAMSELQDEGVIDLTQAHDLASATGLDTGNVARSKAAFAMARAMKIVGWTFHVPEVMNRQVTALAAFRLEMERSGDRGKAMDMARESIKRTHFDYSSSNRARYMQGNLARVVLQFKSYAQQMTYLLGRSLHQALLGETPEVKRIARRQFVATLGATFAMAGALGLPGLGAAMGLIGMAVGAADDDDRPWDWKVEFRNMVADAFGKEAGEVLSHGLPRALMPWDVAGRVGMGDLWWRSNDREGQSPREAFASDMANILGPSAGLLLGWYTAADHMARGNYSKAAEAIVPKFIRDPLQASRFASEGITSYKGEPLMETTAAEEVGRLLGFTPARASEMYEGRNAVMNAKTAVEDKRQRLLTTLAKTRMGGDAQATSELWQEVSEFNRRNPQFAIGNGDVTKSILTTMRNRSQTKDGVTLPKKKDALREVGRFADVE